jgi:hypothetical protein
MGMVGYGHRGRVAGWALPGVGSGWSTWTKLFPKLCFLISTKEWYGDGGTCAGALGVGIRSEWWSTWTKLFPKLCFLISTRERHGVGGNY